MNREETLNYIRDNFNVSAEAMRLIDNILQYVELNSMDEDEEYSTLCFLLDGTIGLSDSEIKRIVL